MKKFIYNIVLFLIFSAPFTELTSRLFMNYNAPFSERKKYSLQYENGNLLPNQILYHTKKGKLVRDSIKYKINKYGHRGENYKLIKNQGEIRIIFLGSSSLFDEHFYYSVGGDFTRQISAGLDTNIRVINTSIPGLTINNINDLIQNDLLKLNPDILVISSIWNDIKNLTSIKSTLNQIKHTNNQTPNNPLIHPVNKLDSLFSFSSVYRKVRDHYWSRKLKVNRNKKKNRNIINSDNHIIRNFDEELKKYKNTWIEIIDYLKFHKIIPIIAIEERLINYNNTIEEKHKIKYYMVNVNSHNELVNIYNKCDSILYSISETKNIPLIDFNIQIPKNLDFFVDHVHTTESGSRFRAERYKFFFAKFLDQINNEKNKIRNN